MKISEIHVGDRKELSHSFDFDMVQLFSKLSLDRNPIHLSTSYAEKTIFKKPIVHGMLYSSLISALIANQLPGPGSVYKSQELNFVAPVFHGEKVTAVVEVIEIVAVKSMIVLNTFIYKNEDVAQIVLTGQAWIKKIDLL